ncbi:unnamed protein product [Phytophthora fragariaefolia]|uniref:Unnamed protein product n=1 Tax=Phytophthora fragariaefolia TaxID=1490495 RepID=A0A9W7D4T1_9STRA|nr:unnamed protein product [Phytophthora fragariaefolia]
MSFDKARTFSLIRQAIRLLDNSESEGKVHVELRRIVIAAERIIIGNCATAPSITIEELDENQCIAQQDSPGLDTPEYWQEIYNVLEDNNALGDENSNETFYEEPLDDVTSSSAVEYNNEEPNSNGIHHQSIEVPGSNTNLSDTQQKGIAQVVFQGYEDIAEPVKTEFPRTNDKAFPQESKLNGIRGQKFHLSTLFSSESTFGLTPYPT